MSMLAERRQKQKWSLNPRGKWWAEDSNKFGQKMLEKMGWTKGKGLGANEQGITEFSNVSYKNDTSGIGYDDKSSEAWTEHREKFSNFLEQLNREQTQDTVKTVDDNMDKQSIELKSKQSQARVHYQKFTRGKDINKYKCKDLANIFGQKELTGKTQIKIDKADNNCGMETSSNKDNWYGVVTINGGNMVDYFKLKSKYNNATDYLKYNTKMNNDTSLSSSMTDNRTTDSESENDQRIGFGFISKVENSSLSNYGTLKEPVEKSSYAFDNPCLSSPIEDVYNIKDSSSKSAKKRKKKYENDTLHTIETDKHNARKKLKTDTIDNCGNGFVNSALNLDANPEEDCNGKEFEVSRAQFGLENCGLDLTDERNDKKRVTFNDHVMLCEYNINSTKKKKGEATLDKFEVENKKNKKKRKHENITTPISNGFVNKALDIEALHEEINDNELNEHKTKKIKKRRICKTSSLETIQESPEKEITEINIESEIHLNTGDVENAEIDTEQKLKKKKKKKNKVEKIIVVDITNEEPDIEIEDVISKKIKKDKKSKEEVTVISKKHKNKKNKENSKSEKDVIQIEVSDDQQDISSNSKQQHNDNLIKDDNKNEKIIETLSVSTTKEEKEEEMKSLEASKQKKKKSKSINKEDCSSTINECYVEKEISDKENIDKEQCSPTKSTKKHKKSKKSKDKNISDIGDSSNLDKEDMNENVKQEKVEKAESTDTPSKKENLIDTIENIISSPWSVKARMSKKMLVTLFHNNAILDFPGSNIRNIKGYGADIESELDCV
ncbi:hypothetical protein P5V15_001587 [Pogonomyrmex californicus]